ncbi:hypothetical protein LCGC14_2770700 [marine sediment metagenome]|uniref:Uncharacterized protein n=1 Tax=marine sediment metagenome TaxID=412755 RepID=A0A0F8YWB7_9ZZZZ
MAMVGVLIGIIIALVSLRPTRIGMSYVNEGELGERCDANPELSREYILGKCTDYRRSLVSLITGIERPPSRTDEDIVEATGKQNLWNSSVGVSLVPVIVDQVNSLDTEITPTSVINLANLLPIYEGGPT